jgi:hypothetical protein
MRIGYQGLRRLGDHCGGVVFRVRVINSESGGTLRGHVYDGPARVEKSNCNKEGRIDAYHSRTMGHRATRHSAVLLRSDAKLDLALDNDA